MNTPFGKLLEKSGFQKCFFIVVLSSALIGAVINIHAASLLVDHVWVSYLIGIAYAVLGVVSLLQNKIAEKYNNKKLEILIGFYSCFFIYNFMILVLGWVFLHLLPFSPHAQAIGVLLLDILSIAVVLMGYLHAKKISCVSYSVHLGVKNAPYRIAMLSDIHLGVFVDEKHIRRMVDKVNRLNPDLIVICGDIIDVNNHILEDNSSLERIGKLFCEMRAKDGVFAVVGNHDPNISNRAFQKFLSDAHITLLHNQVVRLPDFYLIGRTDPTHNERCPMEQLSKEISSDIPAVVLDHNPIGISEAAEYGADLVLSGHTHKGQFVPVTYFTKLANGKHFFYGYEQFGKTQAIISSGAGYFQLPVRIGTDNEVVKIELL